MDTSSNEVYVQEQPAHIAKIVFKTGLMSSILGEMNKGMFIVQARLSGARNIIDRIFSLHRVCVCVLFFLFFYFFPGVDMFC